MKTWKRWKKLRFSGSGTNWSKDALDELQREIDGDRDSARWLRMSRALSRVRQAIAESDKLTNSALDVAAARVEEVRRARSASWHERRQLTLRLGEPKNVRHGS